MKDVGRTIEGNYIVELTRQEEYAFEMLCRAIEGKPWPDPFERTDSAMGYNFTHVFEIVRAWAIARFKINEFENLIDEMKKSLEKK